MKYRLEDVVFYNPETGEFTWKFRDSAPKAWNSRFAGKPAFCYLNKKGYLVGAINSKHMYAHRAAWEISNGPIPDGFEIDHVNRNSADNRLVNLRLATKSQNTSNSKGRENATSRFKGVNWCVKANKWRVNVFKDRELKHLEYFDDEVDAAIAYDVAAENLHGKFANLNFHQGVA